MQNKDINSQKNIEPLSKDKRKKINESFSSKAAKGQGENKYRTLFHSIDDGFCIIELIFNEDDNPVDYIFEEVNAAFEVQTGLADVEGRRISTLDADHEQYWFDIYGKVARTGESKKFTRVALHKFYDVYAFPVGDHPPYKVASIFDEITDRLLAQEEREHLLREVENEREKLAEIFQHAPSFMCILEGPDHVFERANDLYYKLVGDREIIGKPVREAIPETIEQGFVEQLDEVYTSGEPYSATSQQVILHQGEDTKPKERYLDFVFQPLRNSEGEVTGIFVQGVDLTQRKEAQKELQKMNETLEKRVEERTASLLAYQKQLRSLASKLSRAEEQERHRLATELHDNLGQMLAVNKMKMDMLPEEALPSAVSGAIEEVRSGIDDALKYTRDLMSDLKPPPSLDKEDVRASIQWLAKKLKKHDLEVQVEDDGQPKQTSEEIRTTLLQCVRELLFNIRKHAGVKDAFIAMQRQGRRVQIVVRDEGKGFNPEAEDSAPSENGGFGLFNIRERMDLLGGNMEITSAPGEGTSVLLQAPLKRAHQAVTMEHSVEEEKKISSRSQLKKIKVLLADDHQMIREGLKKIVNSENDLIVIGEASDGKEAVDFARKTSPDIIVMDVNMPTMDGIEATRQIMSAMENIRVVGLSLHDHPEVINSMRSAGASAYLTKNEAFETLCATIRSEANLLD